MQQMDQLVIEATSKLVRSAVNESVGVALVTAITVNNTERGKTYLQWSTTVLIAQRKDIQLEQALFLLMLHRMV